MTDASLSATTARATERRVTYRRLLGVNLALNALIGLAALLVPTWLNGVLFGGATTPGPWLAFWGIALIFLAALYLPGWLRPTTIRMPNLVGLLERTVTGLAFLIAGLPLFGLYALAFAALLGWSYYRLFQAELATRP
jgi:hypothetical protein